MYDSWCRHPRPNRPFGHCLIPAKCCPVTLNLAWCLVFKERDMLVGGDNKSESLGWNSERPQKTIFVQLDESQRVAQGHSLPLESPQCAQENCTNCEGENESGPHLGENPSLPPNKHPYMNSRKVKVLVEKETKTKLKRQQFKTRIQHIRKIR